VHFKCLAAMLLGCVLEPRWSKRKTAGKPALIMYGHSLSGNLKAFFDYAMKKRDLPYSVYYVTIDEREYEKLMRIYGRGILLGTKLVALKKILSAAIMMTSHGPGIFYLLKWVRPKVKFVDVWHGVGFKGEDPAKISKMHFYSATFVSSAYYKKEIYSKIYGFADDQIIVTGYPRVDMFCDTDKIAAQVKHELGLNETKYIVLFAPTYRRGDDQSEVPFGLSASDFLRRLNALCEKIDATLIVRLHMNSKVRIPETDYSRVRILPQKEYPETNNLLTSVDVVITDWSSIACDFYTLIRPVIYVENPMPSTHVGQIPGVDRIGDHVRNIEELELSIEKNLKMGKSEIREMISNVLNNCYKDTLDGCSGQRYDEAIRELLKINNVGAALTNS